MSRGRITAGVIIALLVISMFVGLQVTRAFSPPDFSNKKIISITSPINDKSYNTKDSMLNFYVNISGLFLTQPSIAEIHYQTDWQSTNITVLENDHVYDYPLILEYLGDINLTSIPEGKHTVLVQVYAHAWWYDVEYNIPQEFWFVSSSNVNFTIDSIPPTISNISLGNKTYNQNNIPLSFNIDEPTSWIGYSLDGQSNITVAGNATVTGLVDGSHNLVVYANDTAGNTGKSDTVSFTVKIQPSPTPSPSIPEFPSWIILVLTVAASVFLVIFKTRAKHKRTDTLSLFTPWGLSRSDLANKVKE